MKDTVFLYADDERLRWHTGAGEQAGTPADFAAAATSRDAELVLIAPAQRVALRDVAFAPTERRLLRQTVPYSLEEELVDDVDAQHVALGAATDNRVPVAIVDRDWLQQWLQRCEQAGLDIKRALPEQLLLPYRENCWTLRIEPQRWLVRIGAYRGFALEPESAQLALQLLLDGADELPQALLVESGLPPDEIAAVLPELLRGIVEVLEPAAPAADAPLIDLLQGAFARVLPWRRWWRQWQRVAIVFGVAVLAHALVLGAQQYGLKKQNIALRQQIETAYRSVEPRGVVNDPELQLRRKLKALQGSGGSNVMTLLQQVGGALHKIDGVSVQNLTYSEQQHELRVGLTAAAFKDVETVRVAIAAAGLNAQLVGSNTDGDKTRAQLRIRDR